MKWAAYCTKEEQKRESEAEVGLPGDVGVPPWQGCQFRDESWEAAEEEEAAESIKFPRG